MTAAEFKYALKHLGISQRDLASRLGLAVSTVNRWAVGEAEVPQYAAYVLELLEERGAIAKRLLRSVFTKGLPS